MKTMLLLFTTIITISSVVLFENAQAETMFSKDLGEGLSKEQCQQRNDLFGSYYEPILDLAKLKIETHPVFKELTENDSYKIISTDLRSTPFSENCNMDLPSFGIHYATNMTDNSYTRIYVNLERVSYDVHEITTRLIEHSWIDPPKSEPLPFYNEHWDVVHMVGQYYRAVPPKSPQIFKIPYIAVNGHVNHIDTQEGSIVAEVSSNEWGIFALRIPRNYPYTDHDDSLHPGHGFEAIAIVNGPEEVQTHTNKTDCFFDVWLRFSGNKTIELPITWSYLMNDPMHGDSDVPEYCLAKTIVDEHLNYLATLSPHKQVDNGVSPYLVTCKDEWKLVVKHDGSPACVSYNTASALWSRGWADTSTDIYTKYATDEILNEFSSKIKSKEEALKIVENFTSETNLALNADVSDPNFKITSDLYYVTSKGENSVLRIDEKTGLPTQILGFDNEGFYTTPNWYAELQKDYLGMSSQRIEDGHVAWKISYRICDLCKTYSTFYVDALTGEILNTEHLDELFVPYWDRN